jgi:hypothetical protein
MKLNLGLSRQKQHSTRRMFTIKLDLNLRKKLLKCYIQSIALYGAETWTLQEVDKKNLKSFLIWCWRSMEKKSLTIHVENEVYIESRRNGMSYIQ